jgi:hypothetical protein
MKTYTTYVDANGKQRRVLTRDLDYARWLLKRGSEIWAAEGTTPTISESGHWIGVRPSTFLYLLHQQLIIADPTPLISATERVVTVYRGKA